MVLAVWKYSIMDNGEQSVTTNGINNARVACRQLGYRNALKALQRDEVPQGSGMIYLDRVDCRGSEQKLFSCPRESWDLVDKDCSHSKDAGVQCSSKSKTICNIF